MIPITSPRLQPTMYPHLAAKTTLNVIKNVGAAYLILKGIEIGATVFSGGTLALYFLAFPL